MTLTKADKEWVLEQIREYQPNTRCARFEDINPLAHIDFEKWKEKGAISKLTGLIIPKEDLVLANGKKYFTWDEMMELQEYLPSGWRAAPTRHEWVLLAEEFGGNWDGELSPFQLIELLGLNQNGYVLPNNMTRYNIHLSEKLAEYAGDEGRYWAFTASSYNDDCAFHFSFGDTTVYEPCANAKDTGYSVRCVYKGKK